MNRTEDHIDNASARGEQHGGMTGFDPEFTDIVDYILRITWRIWEGKQPELCRDYYSRDCPVYTLAGVSTGAEEVVRNTRDTQAAFPDRTLHADAVIWDGDDRRGFHTSHRISSRMTNLGDSDMGPATGRRAAISVIAHCIVKNNRIIEEWLVRDNYSLAEQLGFDPRDVARRKALTPMDERFANWRASELRRVQQAVDSTPVAAPVTVENDPGELVRATLQNIWNARRVNDVQRAYGADAKLHASADRELQGHEEIARFYSRFHDTLPNLKLSVDYTCQQPATAGTTSGVENAGVAVAARWTLAGDHTGEALYGEPTGAPILIMGESHYLVADGLIQEEWTVFDELSVWVQIFRARADNKPAPRADTD